MFNRHAVEKHLAPDAQPDRVSNSAKTIPFLYFWSGTGVDNTASMAQTMGKSNAANRLERGGLANEEPGKGL